MSTINVLCNTCHGIAEPRRIRKHFQICPYCHSYNNFEAVNEPVRTPEWYTGGNCHPHFMGRKVYHKAKAGAL